MREPLRTQLVELTRWMHCYYSNLIEGQQTRVRDIEAAVNQHFATEPAKRELQRLALAHLEVQRWAVTQAASPHSAEAIRELHRRFYVALPEEMRVATTSKGAKTPLIPGELRERDVEVGSHVGPPHKLVPDLLSHFQWWYESADFSRIQRIIAVGASHHRLAWIHPFRDGNGRVVRLFSEVVIRQLGIDGGGLWSLSRGFARNRDEYYARLANADQERRSSSADDGRGHLSERALWDFCAFTLRTMVDQIAFMERLLDLDGLEQRIEHYVHIAEPAVAKEADRIFLLLREALLRGQFARGEAARIVGASERTGRDILALAVGAGLLTSESPKTPVSLALPAKVLDTYFPQLFPSGQGDGP
ncbi:MAG: Fic family protein [Opitutaceae bacterium]|nr:Fic family protein [Opitutaceae bacterium]